jgi:hypothetical protein
MHAISYDDFIIEVEYDQRFVANDNIYNNPVREIDKHIDALELDLWRLNMKRARIINGEN